MLEAILQVRPSDEVTIEEDDRRIINKCMVFYTLNYLLLIYRNSYRFYSSSDNSFTEKNGNIGTCIITKPTPIRRLSFKRQIVLTSRLFFYIISSPCCYVTPFMSVLKKINIHPPSELIPQFLLAYEIILICK